MVDCKPEQVTECVGRWHFDPLGSSPVRVHDATLLVVGDELLAGAVADRNGHFIAGRLRERGVRLREMRFVRDDIDAIARAVQDLRSERRWLFVVGGLGPTHDDVTAAGIAAAFGCPLQLNPDAVSALREHHAPQVIPEGRLAGARLPAGACVLPDKVSGASGFVLKDVIALPGDPVVAMHLFELATAHIEGIAILESSLKVSLLESDIADELREFQLSHLQVNIGSYPYFGDQEPRLNLVLRSRDGSALSRCEVELRRLIDSALARHRHRRSVQTPADLATAR